MKNEKHHQPDFLAVVIISALLLAVVLLVSSNTYAITRNKSSEDSGKKNSLITDNAVQNLLTGIKSENKGLKKSSIYFAGFYEVEETIEALSEELRKESDESIKVLIVLALFKIGSEDAISAIREITGSEKSLKVKTLGNEILDQYSAVKH